MGITGTEVSKEAAVMILTDDNFATIVGAVEYGRGLYDNLLKYLRFQMSTLVAYIAIFIGAGIFSIAGGIPLNPLQILWLNMVIDIPLAVALGFDEPSAGLMARAPRPVGAPVLSSANWVRLCAQGFVMTVGALVAYQIGDAALHGHRRLHDAADHAVAVPPLRGPAGARPAEHDLRPGTRSPAPRSCAATAIALLAIIAVTAIGFLQRCSRRSRSASTQWLICIGLASSLVVVEEVIKFFIRRRDRNERPEVAAAPSVASLSPADVDRDPGRSTIMAFNLRNRNFVKLLDFTPDELRFLLKLSRGPQGAPSTAASSSSGWRGKNIALIFEKTSTRTRTAFEVAAYDQGAHVTYLEPSRVADRAQGVDEGHRPRARPDRSTGSSTGASRRRRWRSSPSSPACRSGTG